MGMVGWNRLRYEAVDVDSTGQPTFGSGRDETKGSDSIKLDQPTSRRTQFPNWLHFLDLPLLGLAYLAHVRYRRYSPRRLPTFTSMKLPELYAYQAIAHTGVGIGLELKEEVLGDPDLRLLEQVARSLRNNVFNNKSVMGPVDRALDQGGRELNRKFRNAAYAGTAGSVGKRLAWWHNHIWSREETWYRAAVIWISLCGNDTISVNDYDRCVTHLANTFETDGDFDYQDYILWTIVPFVASVPFAMAARWTQRRGLFRPMNGLQRLFLWSTLYPGTMQAYQHYANLRELKDKRVIAKHIRDKLGIDPLISKMVT